MKKYEELLSKKKKLKWDEITKEELKELFKENIPDSLIAELYDVNKSKVAYKRKKWGITMQDLFEDKLKEKDDYKKLNYESKDRLLDKEKMDKLAKGLTHYIFRNGPIEDMHADGKFSQSDMKKLNKFMVNRIGSILSCIYNEDWLKLEITLAAESIYGTDWDKCEPDFEEMDILYKNFLNGRGSIFPNKI